MSTRSTAHQRTPYLISLTRSLRAPRTATVTWHINALTVLGPSPSSLQRCKFESEPPKLVFSCVSTRFQQTPATKITSKSELQKHHSLGRSISMNTPRVVTSLVVVVVVVVALAAGVRSVETGASETVEQHPVYLDARAPISVRVSDLVSRMTLEEKVNQTLNDYYAGAFGPGQHTSPLLLLLLPLIALNLPPNPSVVVSIHK